MRTRHYVAISTVVAVVGGLAALGGPAATAAGPSHRTVDAMDSNEHVTNNELTIAANPVNASNLVTGWNDWNLNEGCGTTYSTDGGKTWAAHQFVPGITNADNSGNAYTYTSSDGDSYTQGIYQ